MLTEAELKESDRLEVLLLAALSKKSHGRRKGDRDSRIIESIFQSFLPLKEYIQTRKRQRTESVTTESLGVVEILNESTQLANDEEILHNVFDLSSQTDVVSLLGKEVDIDGNSNGVNEDAASCLATATHRHTPSDSSQEPVTDTYPLGEEYLVFLNRPVGEDSIISESVVQDFCSPVAMRDSFGGLGPLQSQFVSSLIQGLEQTSGPIEYLEPSSPSGQTFRKGTSKVTTSRNGSAYSPLTQSASMGSDNTRRADTVHHSAIEAINNNEGCINDSESLASWGKLLLEEAVDMRQRLRMDVSEMMAFPSVHISTEEILCNDEEPAQVDMCIDDKTSARELSVDKPYSNLRILSKTKDNNQGAPIIVRSQLSRLSETILKRCCDLGWIQLFTPATDTELIESCGLLIIMAVESVERRSGHKLCARSLTYLNCLTMGLWIVDIAWLSEALQRGSFPLSTSSSEEDIRLELDKYEVGGCTLDSILGNPKRWRLEPRDNQGCSTLLLGYEFILLEPNESDDDDKEEGVCMISDVRMLLYRCGGKVIGLDQASSLQPSAGETVDEDCTCYQSVGDDEDDRDVTVLALSLRSPIRLEQIRTTSVSSRVIRDSREEELLRMQSTAVISVDWLFDAICNRRPSRDFKLFF